ncbi:alpha/beta fold hydrolase [Rhodococcus sp. 14-2483-1-2]|uniref:esterase/lipase family protein n=1 Tax=Rhodococcus sp. 14-2483-1-2 TaxID=2023147 RepID=UPI000B9BFE4B|nr:alpha/beta fold hydrolase [Rhodococcus sp. 14-2483-1-2]OZF26110.1 triacylglycerol lipase [Rhodococcus sp. 14-2483-1-2]
MPRTLTRAAATITVTIAAILAVTGIADAEPVEGPLPVPFDLNAVPAALFPNVAPPGANDPQCTPSPEHPNPVVLINPTATTQAIAWQTGAPFLANNGYCVFTFNYGNPAWASTSPIQATDDIRSSARTLSATVARVLASTGAHKVDLVGHSQGGGLLPSYYINVLDGADKVDKFVGISPSHHGTTASEVVYGRSLIPPVGRAIYDTLAALAPAFTQQAIGSDLVQETYAHGDTRPGPTYTTLITKYDEIVTPFTQQYLDGPDVRNILLQQDCELDRSEHLSTLFSRRVWYHVLNALDPTHTTPVPCIPVDPFFPNVN